MCVCIHKHTHTRDGILLGHKNSKILPLVATWMHLEGIMLCEISQRKIKYLCFHLHVKSKKINQRTIKQKQDCRSREQTSGHQRGEGRGYG